MSVIRYRSDKICKIVFKFVINRWNFIKNYQILFRYVKNVVLKK